MTRGSLLAAAGWIAAAGLAVLVGLAAISVIGRGLMSSSGSPPRTRAEVARELAAQPPPSSTSPATSAAPSSPPVRSTRSFTSRGGIVVARCAGDGTEIVSMSPDTGFNLHEVDQGVQSAAEGEFRGVTDNHDRVKVSVTCPAGRLTLTTRNGG